MRGANVPATLVAFLFTVITSQRQRRLGKTYWNPVVFNTLTASLFNSGWMIENSLRCLRVGKFDWHHTPMHAQCFCTALITIMGPISKLTPIRWESRGNPVGIPWPIHIYQYFWGTLKYLVPDLIYRVLNLKKQRTFWYLFLNRLIF